MKILSSEVNTQTQVHKSLEVSLSEKFTFSSEVVSFMRIKEEDLLINNIQEVEETNRKEEVDEIVKHINIRVIELFLENFIKLRDEENQTKKETIGFDSLIAKITGQKTISSKLDNDEPQNRYRAVIKRSFSYEKTVEYKQEDSISFKTNAIIKTKNKDINLDLDFSFSQKFYEKHSEKIDFEELSFLDPLVINYNNESSGFDLINKEFTFKFDLDLDGVEEEIPMLNKGVCFLALDKNSNGIIDNGSELFGPSTDNGFEELRVYDKDKNGWIDENDEVFDKLRIYSKNKDGEDTLVALGETGVGALYLNNSKIDLNINKNVEESLANIKSTSIFLKEDGTAGLLTSLDFIA